MFKINIITVGKIKEDYFKKAVEEYLKRLTRFAEVKVVELDEVTFSKEDGLAETILKKEEEKILPLLKGQVICLAIEGKQFSSEEFSNYFVKAKSEGVSEMTFVIGSSYGLSKEIKKRAKLLLSFSKMTFPHQMFRVILLEQIYRAFMIENGSSYHK
ncbi:MAG: 23S rRNA (pseudouridine(1915)-N(3))-methyltransferase RlmH [Clostridia bacterium]|nr:23S rRNA (pseudouridine(1915)-N(3))-methyltransferase RlmH [Clostridia bacterium]